MAGIRDINGHVDGIDGHTINGWARNPGAPGSAVELAIVRDKTMIGRIIANESRPDLAAAGLEHGNYGFHWIIPPRFRDGVEHVFHIFSLNDNRPLINSPVPFLDHRALAQTDAVGSITTWLDALREEGIFAHLARLPKGDAVAYLYMMILGRMPEEPARIRGGQRLKEGQITLQDFASEIAMSEERQANRLLQVPPVAQVRDIIDDYANVYTTYFRAGAVSSRSSQRR